MDDMSRLVEEYAQKVGVSSNDTIGFAGMGELQLVAICIALAREKGTKVLLGSKRIYQLDESELIIGAMGEIPVSPLVKNPHSLKSKKFVPRVELTWIESLSISFIAYYHNQRLGKDTATLIGVQVDTGYSAQTELMLSDGILLFLDNGVLAYSHIYQQVMAQNLYGKQNAQELTEEVIGVIKKKAMRRASYADGCGLIVSVVTDDTELDITRIIREGEADMFYPSFLVLYRNNFEDVDIYGINKKILEHEDGIELTKLSQKFKKLPEVV